MLDVAEGHFAVADSVVDDGFFYVFGFVGATTVAKERIKLSSREDVHKFDFFVSGGVWYYEIYINALPG